MVKKVYGWRLTGEGKEPLFVGFYSGNPGYDKEQAERADTTVMDNLPEGYDGALYVEYDLDGPELSGIDDREVKTTYVGPYSAHGGLGA